jgi:hypothetical protein
LEAKNLCNVDVSANLGIMRIAVAGGDDGAVEGLLQCIHVALKRLHHTCSR